MWKEEKRCFSYLLGSVRLRHFRSDYNKPAKKKGPRFLSHVFEEIRLEGKRLLEIIYLELKVDW